MKKIFDKKLELTPEELLPILKKLINRLDRQVAFLEGGGELSLEIVPDTQIQKIPFTNGTWTTHEVAVPAVRPENIIINFYDRKIGAIKTIQTDRYPSKSIVKIWSLDSPENDSDPLAIDSYTRGIFVMNSLINEIVNEFKTDEIEVNHGQSVINKNLRISPNRLADLNKWRAVWKYIKPDIVINGAQAERIIEKLNIEDNHQYKGPRFGKTTVYKIIQAGLAGELET